MLKQVQHDGNMLVKSVIAKNKVPEGEACECIEAERDNRACELNGVNLKNSTYGKE